MRAWCEREFGTNGIHFVPLQSNLVFSRLKGTLRGLHHQVAPSLEAKLVRCTRGAVFDLVLDLRRNSPTYLRWYGAHLSADNGRMLYIPEGCAHGFQALTDEVQLIYQHSSYYDPQAEGGVRFDDPAIGIDWPLPIGTVSDRDRSFPLIDDSFEGVAL